MLLLPLPCALQVSQNAGSTVVIWSAWRQLPRRDDELVKGQIGAVSWLRAGSPDLLGSRC